MPSPRTTPIRAIARRPAPLAGLLALGLLLGAASGCGGSTHSTSDPVRHAATVAAGTGTTASVAVGPPIGVASAFSGGARTVGEFARRGAGAGELTEPFGIAVDHRSGDVYVVDTNDNRVEKFTSAGRFLLAWGWGVADGRTRAPQTCTKRCFAGIQGEGPGQLHFAEGAAVDNNPTSRSRGDVYVVDIENRRVDKFSPGGRFLLMFGGGVNRTAGARHDRVNEDVCPVKRGDVCGEGTEGPSGGQLEFATEGSFIAVGSGGTIYLGQRNSVKTFTPSGGYRSRVELRPPAPGVGREPGGVSALAVDGSGDMYVERHGIVGVNEYSPSGQLIRTLEPGGVPAYDEGPAPTLALDPAGNLFVDVYAFERHRIDEYSASGVRIASFDKGPPNLPGGIVDREDGLPGMAYNPRTRLLYVVNADVNVKPIVSRVRMIAPPRP